MSKKVTALQDTTPMPTKPLSREQIRYTRMRIETAAKQKCDAIQQLRWKARDTDVKARDILKKELQAGRFKMPTKAELCAANMTNDMHYSIQFTNWPGGLASVIEHIEKSTPSIDVRMEAIQSEARRIVDELILGDAREALAALRAFEAREF